MSELLAFLARKGFVCIAGDLWTDYDWVEDKETSSANRKESGTGIDLWHFGRWSLYMANGIMTRRRNIGTLIDQY